MKYFIKILFFLFLYQVSFAQTDSVAPLPIPLPIDTFAARLTVSDTLPAPDSIAVTAADTALKIDTTPKPVPPKKIIAQFDTNNLVIFQGDIISKQLQVINGTEKDFSFSIDITYPGEWKALTNTERIYSLSAGDTFFIPVRIIPLGKILGNTKYLIFAYVRNEKNVPVASAHFLAEKRKLIKWDMNISPDEKIYLMNDENSADFSINIFNTGNESVGLMLDLGNFRKDRLVLMDTAGKILKRPVFSFDLKEDEDTTFYFRAKYTQGLRNFRLIDTETYLPGSKIDAQKYSLFAKSRQSELSGNGTMMRGKKIDLIRLPDETKVNPFGQPSIPLLMDMNFLNIMGPQPMMNLILRGKTFLNNGAFLSYNSATYFSSPFLSTQFLMNGSYNIGYYDRKFNVQVGSVGGAGGGGKGIAGNYFINNHHSVGGFFTRGTRFFNATTTSFGASYAFSQGKFRAQTSFAHSTNTFSRYDQDMLRGNISFSLSPKHSFGAGGMISRGLSTSPLNPFDRLGYGIHGSYGGSFFKNRLRSSISGAYSTFNTGNVVSGERINANHSSIFSVKDNFSLRLVNNYTHSNLSLFNPEQTNINNALSFVRVKRKLNVSPSLFYNIANYDQIRFHSRGINLSYSTFDYETNKMIGINFRGGYNKLLNMPGLRDYFFMQSFLFFRYRVWSGNVRYTYGTTSPSDLSFLSGTYPQSLGMSLNNQYQFQNPHFILYSNLTYNYINTMRKHSIGYSPQLFYFTYSGWRFYVSPGIYFIFNKATKINNYFPNTQGETDRQNKVASSTVINAGIRKEFGIPLFWIKVKYPTLVFNAYIDHNGNNKQDKGEVSLENVVIKLGDWEVLTNENGLARVRNVFGDSTYSFSAFSLVDLKGYFANVPTYITAQKDSVFAVPFVKGVKVHGNVYLDREKIAAGSEKPLDLTGIKITALNGKSVHTLTDSKGDFSFYIPYGAYVISMDEKVLGDRFTLMQNNIELELDQKTESIFLTFYIVEKRRKITVKKFNGNGDRIKESDTTITPKPKTIEDLKKEEKMKNKGEGASPGTPVKGSKGEGASSGTPDNVGKDPGGKAGKSPGEKGSKGGAENGKQVDKNEKMKEGKKPPTKTPSTTSNEPIDKSLIKFKVQIGAFNVDVPNDLAEKIKSLPNITESKTEEGLTRYTAGEFSDYESAMVLRQELINKGLATDTTFVIIIADYKGRVFSADEAKELMRD